MLDGSFGLIIYGLQENPSRFLAAIARAGLRCSRRTANSIAGQEFVSRMVTKIFTQDYRQLAEERFVAFFRRDR
jgi:hypothetical protein